MTPAVSLAALCVVTALLVPSHGGPALTAGNDKLVYTQPEQVHLALGGNLRLTHNPYDYGSLKSFCRPTVHVCKLNNHHFIMDPSFVQRSIKYATIIYLKPF